MPSSTDSPPKARLSGNTPSLSERIAALQRRNVSGPPATGSGASATAGASSEGAAAAGAPASSSSMLAPPGSASAASAVKDRIARLQSKGDGESPLLPRSSFGAPAPNPDVASHAVRQFPGAHLTASHGATLRPQMTGGAWLNGMPANTSGAPLRPQMTGGMWGNQYYGASASVPLPRRGPSPTTPTRQQTQPIIHGGQDDAFAELDREAEAAARARETSSDSSSGAQGDRLPTLPSAPETSPPPSSPPSTLPVSSASSTTTLPNLPEAPSDPPLVKVDLSPDTTEDALTSNGQSREIEIGIRAPEDAEAQRKLEQIVSAADSLNLGQSGSSGTPGQGGHTLQRDPSLNNPLYQDITDDDDRLLAGDEFGTLTVLKRSRTGSSSVSDSDGLLGVGRAAVNALLDGSEEDEEDQSEENEELASPHAGGKDHGSSSGRLLASPPSPSPARSASGGGGGGGRGSVSSVSAGRKSEGGSSMRSANRNGISGVDQLYANGDVPASLPFGSPVRGSGSGASRDSPLMQSPVQQPPSEAGSSRTMNGNGGSMVSSSSSSSFGGGGGGGARPGSGFRLPTSDSIDSGMTVTSSSTKTLQDSSFSSSPTGSGSVSALRRGSAASGDTFLSSGGGGGGGSPTHTGPRRSGSLASSGRTSVPGRRSATMPVDPILESESGAAGSNGSGGGEHGRDGSGPASGSASGPGAAMAAAARAREAIALARSKSQGGRLARPPPPGRTLTAAELDASDDDYEPGWASIISRK